jgi:hypothetical protein
MKLQQFDGGVATRLAPQLLALNQGVVYENIDNATGVLTPVRDKLPTGIASTLYAKYYEATEEWLDATVPTDFVEFQRKMYLTDRVSRPQKYFDGTYKFLGITRPGAAPEVQSQTLAKPLEDLTVVNSVSAGDLPASDFDYLLFNVNNGLYSTPFRFTVYAGTTTTTRASGEVLALSKESRFGRNSITTAVKPSNRSITFSSIEGDLQDSALLYRWYDGAWRLLRQFNSKAETYTDSIHNISANSKLDEVNISSFNGTYQYVYTYYNSEDGTESAPSDVSAELVVDSGNIEVGMSPVIDDPQVTHKRLYRVGGNLTQFSMVAEIDKDITQYIDVLDDTEVDGRLLESDNFSEAPTGLQYLSESYAMLFGAVASTLRFTPIGKPDAWPPEYSLQFDEDITGLGPVANGVLVFTRSKTYIVTGTGPTSLSQQSLRGDQGCIAFESISEAFAGTLIWASEDGLCTSSGNNVTSLTKQYLGEVMLEPTSSAVVDEVYYCHTADGSILAWDYRFATIPKYLSLGTEALKTAKGALYGYNEGELYSLYKGTTNTTFKYKSPRFVEGAYSENKTYKKVYVRSKGDIIIDIIIDDEIVTSCSLEGTTTHQLQVPQQLQRGYSIQFNISGTGTVHEIEYKAAPRQND